MQCLLRTARVTAADRWLDLVAALVASVVAWPTSSRYATSKVRSAACRHKAHTREDDDVMVG